MAKTIFGVKIDGPGWPEIGGRLEAGERLWVVTANPEILLEARRDRAYFDVLKAADVRTVDGFGLMIAVNVLRGAEFVQKIFFKKRSDVLRRKPVRLTGVELSEFLLQMAFAKAWKIGLLGGEFNEANEAAHELQTAYSGIEVRAEQGGVVELNGQEDTATEEARSRMIVFGPQVLLVAMGHPRQELWIAEHLHDFPELKIVVGVGGTFNYWAGRSQRAPFVMRALGFEWFWRLIKEPRRWKRILRAVVIFPLLFIFDLLRLKK